MTTMSRLGASLFVTGILLASTSQASLLEEPFLSSKVAKEIKTVLENSALEPALNGHFITSISYLPHRLTVTAGACIVQMDIKQLAPETTQIVKNQWGELEKVIPRVVEGVLASTTAECAEHGDVSTHDYPYAEWIKILAASANVVGEPDDHVQEVSYSSPDTITVVDTRKVSNSWSVKNDILPQLDYLLAD